MVLGWENSLARFFGRFHDIQRRFTQQAAFALISTEDANGRSFLLQWNPKWQCYNFVGGKVENAFGDNGDFTMAIRREIAEELGFSNLADIFKEREIEQIHLWQFSKREKKLKLYRFCVFKIQFFPNLEVDNTQIKRALRWLSTKHHNIFVSLDEIDRLETKDGQPISKTVRLILNKLGEI